MMISGPESLKSHYKTRRVMKQSIYKCVMQEKIMQIIQTRSTIIDNVKQNEASEKEP